MLQEYQQAWDQARHLETMRGQYLGFLFTVALGSAALAIPAVGAGVLNDSLDLLMLCGFLTIFFLLTALIYVSVVKLGAVFAQYQRGIHIIRNYFYTDSNCPEAILMWLRFRNLGNPILDSMFFGVQTAAERILRLFLYLAPFGASLIALRLVILRAHIWQVGLVGIVVALTLTGASLLVLAPKGARH
jgi:hypothetical protein